jgi:hypothetical protein
MPTRRHGRAEHESPATAALPGGAIQIPASPRSDRWSRSIIVGVLAHICARFTMPGPAVVTTTHLLLWRNAQSLEGTNTPHGH